ncbi:MAG: putative sugar nucleotidyl transferase [Rubricoccaceae bacterium]
MLCLFEDAHVAALAPLALTRPAFALRVGARTLAETAAGTLPLPDAPLALHTRRVLAATTAEAYPAARVRPTLEAGVLLVNGRWRVRPDALAARVAALPEGPPSALVLPSPEGDVLLAAWLPSPPPDLLAPDALGPDLAAALGLRAEPAEDAVLVGSLADLIDDLEARIAEDLKALGGLGAQDGARVGPGATLVAPEALHLAPGATVEAGAVLDARRGPVRLEAQATVEALALVRGPCWIGPGATVRAGARVDGSAIGPQSKVGGEVHASVLLARSNKAHDGYLGNSYLGEWCNLGAGTDTSNLRNDYGEVSLYDAARNADQPSGRQFAGLFMGDHSKCAIGTTFNTGSVVGVSCNLFGAGFPPRHVPSFAWGGAGGLVPYRPEKALRVAEVVMARRGRALSAADRALLEAVAEAHGLRA